MGIKKGIDVSAWQGKIDWEKAKTEIDFAIIRLGFGTKTLDEQAKRNISELNRLGIPYGVYWFSYAYTVEMARNEAKSVIAHLKELGAKLSYPVYFDWEYDSRKYAAKNGVNVNKTLLCNMATAFCEEVKAVGYYPGIYANPDYIDNHFSKDIFSEYDLWLAHYVTQTNREAHIWQYSSNGRVAGIDGNVDMNRCMVDYPAIIGKGDGKAGSEEKPVSKPTATKDTKIDSVLEVQTWLNNNYATGLTRDGLYGSRTKAALVKALQKELGFTGKDVDGIFGRKTKAAVKNLRYGDKGNLVKVLQGLLVCNGYKGAYVDGSFGGGTEAAVEQYQRKKGLNPDGVAGSKTFTALCA